VCSSEWQIVMCVDVPVNSTAEHAACCSDHAPRPVTAAAALAGARAEADSAARLVKRPDLDLTRGPYSQPVHWLFGHCTTKLEARVPSFRRDGDGETQVGRQCPGQTPPAGPGALPFFAPHFPGPFGARACPPRTSCWVCSAACGGRRSNPTATP
jgi:hypothetical protein